VHPWRLLVLALLLPLCVTAPGPAAASPTPSPAAVAPVDDDAPVEVEVTGLAPRALLDPDGLLQVTGRLVNRGRLPVSEVSVRLLVGDVLISRSALARADAQPGTGRPRGPEAVPPLEELAPGASTSFDLSLPVRDLRLGRIGVHPLQVQARGRVDDARRTTQVGLASTFVPWFPDGPPRPTRLAFLLPLVTEPERTPDGALLGQQTLDEVSDDGRLTGLLETGVVAARGACDALAAALPGTSPPPEPAPPCRGEPVPVTYGVDPDLLETVQALAGEHVVASPSGERTVRPGQPAAAQWLEGLREAVTDPPGAAPSDLLALPFGDPDVVAVTRSRTGLAGDLEQLRLLGQQAATDVVGAEPLEAVAWPPAGRLSAAALDALAAGGTRAVVLSPEALPVRAALVGRTPGARTPLSPTVVGPVDGLVVDEVLSELLTAGPEDAGWQGDRLAEQRWLVETAILAAERPSESRTLVVAPPRQGEVLPAVAGSALLDAGRVPWLCPVALADVVDGTERCALEGADPPPDRQDDRGELEAADGEGELSPVFLQQVAAVRTRAEQLTDEVLVAGTEPAVQTKSRLLRARGRTLSSAWRDDPAGGRRLLALQREEVDRLRSQVQLVTSGRVLLTSDTGVVEVGLSNALDQPVIVGVALNDPVEARLTSSDTGLQTVAGGQQVQVRVRVEARVSGQFVVRATLLDRSGQPFGEPVELVARSTSYGRLALAVTGVAAGVLLVAVGVRLVRRAVRSPAGRPDDLL
jgi:hypothetical protein